MIKINEKIAINDKEKELFL